MIHRYFKSLLQRFHSMNGFMMVDSWGTLLVGSITIVSILMLMSTLLWQIERAYLYDGMIQNVITLVEEGKAEYATHKTVTPHIKTYKGFTMERSFAKEDYKGMEVNTLKVLARKEGKEIYEVHTFLYDAPMEEKQSGPSSPK